MTLKKFLTYLSYVGIGLFILYFVASMAFYHTTYGFKHSDALRYIMYLSVFMQSFFWVYKLWHFREYEEENQNRLQRIGVIVLLIVIFIIIKG